MRHSQLALGYMTGGLLRGWAAALLVALLAAPFTSGLADPLIALAALFLTGLVFAVLGVITGMWAESFDQHSFVANLVITPLALVGGGFYCASTIGDLRERLPDGVSNGAGLIAGFLTTGAFTGAHGVPRRCFACK